MKFFCICLLSQILMFLNFIIYVLSFGYLETGKWTEILLSKILRIQFKVDVLSPPLNKKVKIVFCNHRSFGDFLIDSLFVGHCSHLSRFAVILALPFSALYALATSRVLYFRRDKTSRKSLSKLIARHFNRRKLPLIIYPEGHRNRTLKSLPMKIGALKIAYEGRYPVQCLISTNKELVLDEATFSAQSGVTCKLYRSACYDPIDYECFDDFKNALIDAWEKCWSRAYEAQSERLYTEFEPEK